MVAGIRMPIIVLAYEVSLYPPIGQIVRPHHLEQHVGQ